MDAFIQKCQANIAALEAKRLEIITNGQSYSISGSHNVTQVQLDAIDRAIRQEQMKILRYTGNDTRRVEVTRYE